MKSLFIILFAIAANFAMAQNQQISLKEVLYGKFRPNSVYGIESMKNGLSYTVLENNSVVKYSYETGEKQGVVVDFTSLGINRVQSYAFSENEDKILFFTGYEAIYRRSYLAKFYVYDLTSKECNPLSTEFEKQQLATFSPDGSKVAFVHENNLYVKTLSDDKIRQITTDGKKNFVLNGLPDWVYEEEFGFNKAFEFSNDGKYLAYIKFDETNVKEYTLQYYSAMTQNYNPEANYPYNYTYKYPKAGEDNSVVSVHVYDFESGETKKADIGSDTDIYVPRIQWMSTKNVLSIARLNRLQNKLNLLAFDVTKNTTTQFFELKDKKYIEEDCMSSITFLKDGNSFVIPTELDGYRNLYHYSTNGTLINKITSGKNEIVKLCGVDPDGKKVYFTGVGSNSTRTSVFVVDINGKNRKKITLREGSNDPEFSANFKYFINFYSNTTTPYYITVNNNKGKEIRVIEDNSDLKKTVETYGGIHKEMFAWKNSSGDSLNAYIIKPYDFDENKKYPVLVIGYNGPNYNMVNDDFDFDWTQVLAQKGYIVACTDTRGTGRKGAAFRKCTYGQLGNLETQDLVSFAKYLGNQKYIDSSRLGIWGWSYGGFMSSSVMTRGAGAYKLGIAVAPVEDWEYYDNIYTERYMGLPQDNAEGYKNNSPLKYADKLQGKFLLIYGSCDDNVHPQNSMAFCEALVQADKEFELMQYTNKNHGIRGGNTSFHLYKKMIKFIEDNL
ncbi:MAG: S9 family peptidase [Bacteroidales bacterium]|nr:S9 family peptidase [Bacteroidales bacterium]